MKKHSSPIVIVSILLTVQFSVPPNAVGQRVINDNATQNEIWRPSNTALPGVDSKGDLNIAIPLLTVPGIGGLNYDVTLSYRSGIRVDQESSWIGLGWTFDPGSITRDVQVLVEQDNPHGADFSDIDTLQQDYYHVSMPGRGFAMARYTPNGITAPPPGGTRDLGATEEFRPIPWVPVVIDEVVAEPVLFDNTNATLPASTHTEINAVNYTKEDFVGFILTDETGVRFVFGEPALGTSLLHRDDAQGVDIVDHYVRSWHLIAILGRDYLGTVPDLEENYKNGSIIGENEPGSWVKLNYSIRKSRNRNGTIVGTTIEQQAIYLSEIVTPTHRAIFESATKPNTESSTSWLNDATYHQALKSIKLYSRYENASSLPIKEILLHHTEDGHPGKTTDGRMALDSISTYGSGGASAGSEMPLYTFSYYPTEQGGDSNDADGNGSFVDDDQNEDVFGYYVLHKDSPNSNTSDAKSWSLNSIQFPNGVRNIVNYEDDEIDTSSRIWTARITETPSVDSISYNYDSSKNRQGGVRVTSIERLEGTVPKDTVLFTYPSSGGRLSGVPSEQFEKNLTSSDFYKPSFRGSAAVHYDWVKQVNSDDTFLVNHFSTDQSHPGDVIPLKYVEYWNDTGRFIVQGNEDIGWGIPFKTVSNIGGWVESQSEYSLGLAYLNVAYTPGFGSYGPVGTRWYVDNEPLSTTTTIRPNPSDTSQTITTVKEFEYEHDNKIPSIITESSAGLPTRRTEISYAFETYPDLATANIVSPVAQTRFAEVVDEQNEIYDYHSSEVTTWKEFGSWFVDDSLYAWRPYESYAWTNETAVTSTPASPLESSWSSDNWSLLDRIVAYNAAGRVLESENGLGVTRINTYDSDFKSSLLSTTSIAGLSTTFSYDATTGALVRSTDPDSVVSHFAFDDYGRLLGVANTDSVVVQSATYSLSRERNSTYQESDPNIIQEVLVHGTGGYFDTFDGVNNWIERNLSNTNSTVFLDEGKLVFENDGAGTDWMTDLYYIDTGEELSGKVFVELSATRVQNDTQANLGIALGADDWQVQNGGTGNAVWTVFDNSTNAWSAYSGSLPWDDITTEVSGVRDFRLLIVADVDSQTTDFYVDGILSLADYPFRNAADNIQKIALFNYGRGDSTVWKVDNLFVYSNATIATNYFDSFSQLRQTDLRIGDSFLRTSSEYDKQGREIKTYLPFIDETVGFDSDVSLEASAYYDGNPGPDANSYPFTETEYDAFGQLHEVTPPGTLVDDTQRFGVSYDYAVSSLSVAGQSVDVLKTIITDPEGIETYSFADAYGRVVRDRRILDSSDIDTIYDYDIRDNLVAVTPPNGSNYKSYYNYNTLGQLIGKSTPDADGDGDGDPGDEGNTIGSEDYRYRYDAAGNLRFINDPNRLDREGGGFLVHSYDDFGRPDEISYPTTGLLAPPDFDNVSVDWEPSSFNEPVELLEIDYQGVNVKSKTAITSSSSDEVAFSYDANGRVDTLTVSLEGLADQTVVYAYNTAGLPSSIQLQPNVSGQEFYHWYEYDALGRLDRVYTGTTNNKQTANLEAEYSYSAAGSVDSIDLGGGLQVVNYEYNVRGWLEKINDLNNMADDLFALSLGYDTQGELGVSSKQNATVRKDGNISWVAWRTEDNVSAGPILGYTFEYDDLSRLNTADFGRKYSLGSSWSATSKYDVGVGGTNKIEYDDQGNLLSMHRRNENTGATSFTYN